jgi:chloramphenicol 3-O-phosphotransferase
LPARQVEYAEDKKHGEPPTRRVMPSSETVAFVESGVHQIQDATRAPWHSYGLKCYWQAMPKPRRKKAHGGARVGAGRPPKDESEKAMRVPIFFLPDQLEWVDARAEVQGVSRAEVIRGLVASAMEQHDA